MPEWQAGEKEATADILSGRAEVFMSDEQFIASLGEESEEPPRRRASEPVAPDEWAQAV